VARAEARAWGRRPRALVTGGAGFVGSHLCERLLSEGYQVLCVDNLRTGSLENVAHLCSYNAAGAGDRTRKGGG
jgi:nucleoside-diphosphate-sugar epimerase